MAVTTATDKGLAGSGLSGRGPRPRPPAAGPGRQKHGSGRPEPAGGVRALGVWVKPGLRFIPAWGRGAQTDALVSGLSRSTKATGLLAGRARGGGRRGFSPALREDGFLTRCRLYSQQINNFLSRQQCRPVCVCVCRCLPLPSKTCSPPPAAHGGSAADFLRPRPQLGSLQLCVTIRLSPAAMAASGASWRARPGCELMVRVQEVAGKHTGWRRGNVRLQEGALGSAACLAEHLAKRESEQASECTGQSPARRRLCACLHRVPGMQNSCRTKSACRTGAAATPAAAEGFGLAVDLWWLF